MLLLNSLFDDGSVLCKNFILIHEEGHYIVEWNTIQKLHFDQVIAIAIDNGEIYINPEKSLLYNNTQILQITWD